MRRLFGRLDHNRVARAERRSHLAGDHRRREVPRRDHEHHADRWVVHNHPSGAGGVGGDGAVQAHGLLCVPAEELRRVADLAECIGQWFTVLLDDDGGQFLGVVDHRLVTRTQQLRTGPGRSCCPGLLCGGGSITCGDHVGFGAGRDSRDNTSVGRVEHVKGLAPTAVAPFTVDDDLVLHWPIPRSVLIAPLTLEQSEADDTRRHAYSTGRRRLRTRLRR